MANESVRPGELDDDLVREWNQMRTLVNELKTLQATNRTMLNELKADHNAAMAKLDADAGVTDTNYAATAGIAAADIAAVTTADVDSFSVNW